jgi:hypothetical protein
MLSQFQEPDVPPPWPVKPAYNDVIQAIWAYIVRGRLTEWKGSVEFQEFEDAFEQ